ncbi:MAG: hypothetical protein Q7J82_06645 [Coriobacteriia bacterium]|nr:hypothetical protein [Coriobacteriia bacterium]
MEAVRLLNTMAVAVSSLAIGALVLRALFTAAAVLADTDGADTPMLKRRLMRTLGAAAVLTAISGLVMAVAHYYGYTTIW